VRRLLTESAESGRLAGRARMMMEDAGGFAAQAAASIEAKGEAEGSSVLSTAQEQTTFLASPGMARALSKSSVELDELKTSATGLSIYLVLPARRLATHSRFMRLILTAALGRMEAVPNISTRSATATGFPVLFMLDEFAALGHMEIIEKAAGLMAGYGVKLWTVLQDLTQLKRHYKEGWETFLGNCGIMQFFGNTDATTCEYVSKLLGETETMTESFPELQIQQQAQGMEGRSRALTTAPLLRPDEVARSFARSTGRQLVISPDHRPLVCERIAYHDSNFTDLTRGR
jgi:type IV secretion system protein VirD4